MSTRDDEPTKTGETAADEQETTAADATATAGEADILEEKYKTQLAELNDKYIRLYSEFDNFRKRTAKEKIELVKTAGEDTFKAILPVIDDFERGIKAINDASNVDALKEGVNLIYHKLNNILTQKGLQPMEAIGQPFDAEVHEAITNIPAPSDDMKGKVVEELEKGYYLNGKVIRFAKVVVGS